MAGILAADVARDFKEIVGWPYESPGSNDQNGIDCSGAWVRTFRKHGLSIPHGSNSIFRQSVSGAPFQIIDGRTNGLEAGMAIFKCRAWTDKYASNRWYKQNPGDIYHIGAIVSVNPFQIVHATSPVAKMETSVKAWHYAARIDKVIYGNMTNLPSIPGVIENGGDIFMEPFVGTVYSDNGLPVKMRKLPTTTAVYLAKINPGEKVQVLEKGESEGVMWATIVYNNERGYMMSSFIKGWAEGDDSDVGDNITATPELLQRVEVLEADMNVVKDQIAELMNAQG